MRWPRCLSCLIALAMVLMGAPAAFAGEIVSQKAAQDKTTTCLELQVALDVGSGEYLTRFLNAMQRSGATLGCGDAGLATWQGVMQATRDDWRGMSDEELDRAARALPDKQIFTIYAEPGPGFNEALRLALIEVEAQQALVDEQQSRIQEMEEQEAKLQVTLANVSADREYYREQQNGSRQVISNLGRQIEGLQTDLSEETQKNSSLERQLADVSSKVLAQEEHIEELKRELQERDATIGELNENTAIQASEHESLRLDNTGLLRRSAELEEMVATRDQQLTEIREAAKGMGEALESARKATVKLQGELTGTTDRNAELQGKVAALETANEALERNNTVLQGEATKQRQAAEEARIALTVTKSHVAVLEDMLASTREQLQGVFGALLESQNVRVAALNGAYMNDATQQTAPAPVPNDGAINSLREDMQNQFAELSTRLDGLAQQLAGQEQIQAIMPIATGEKAWYLKYPSVTVTALIVTVLLLLVLVAALVYRNNKTTKVLRTHTVSRPTTSATV